MTSRGSGHSDSSWSRLLLAGNRRGVLDGLQRRLSGVIHAWMLVYLYDLLTALENRSKSIFEGEQKPQNAGRFFGGHLRSARGRTDNVALKALLARTYVALGQMGSRLETFADFVSFLHELLDLINEALEGCEDQAPQGDDADAGGAAAAGGAAPVHLWIPSF